METTKAFSGLECTDCGTVHDADTAGRCPNCNGPLDPTYDRSAVDVRADVIERHPDPGGMWAFDAVLPFPARNRVGAAEGGTPLVDADRLAEELGVASVEIKDESRNPTGTVLDRGLSLAVTAAAGHAVGDDVEPLALAAAGNAAQSAAAYAGRVDLRLYAFVPSRCAFSNKAMVNVHGGEMQVVGGRYDDARAAIDDQLAADYYSLQEFTTPYRHEGAKTVALELLADRDWTIPDAVFVPTGTGELLVGVVRGFELAVDLDLIDCSPDVIAVQPSGCAPIAAAHERGLRQPEPWDVPDTIVGELEIPDPEGGSRALEALDRIDGRAVTVEDEEILESAVTINQTTVVEMGPGGGAAAAGAWELASQLDSDAEVVLLNTESGGKTPDVLRSHLMSKGI
ncbi:pyridoxal-phosphate dependent enzyme [Halalkaliarchaeum sp. AArc-GB]|uniref:threonine synthase n=1 Tax=Halalkaliarchaeum sp. AArc-GB TaxID=3074078 RepID=UPI002865672B|nr:pyridoxal-phosphate dependent enzyme [Halalkaliarchaeum sp. AArc-GB]MDR5673968.1 pyridoxal-phosphate dependent enzyme [Halalkaliarchaeum sp. AArc-GB]